MSWLGKRARGASFGIRLQLSAAFLGVSLLMLGFAALTVKAQFSTVRRAALLEAEQVGNMIAQSAALGVLEQPQLSQEYVSRLNAVYKRDVVIVDRAKKGIVDVDRTELGKIYRDDPAGEVGATLRDGLVRTFDEVDPHGAGARHIVLPLRRRQGVPGSPIIGAVILEYTPIYEELWGAQAAEARMLVLGGVACSLLAMFFGLCIATNIARRLAHLGAGLSGVSSGNYRSTLTVGRRDEIGDLGLAFNAMAADLSFSRDKLLAHGMQLEARVAARTHELSQTNLELRELNARLAAAQVQLVQSEKMASLGQLAAGVAHEINNPIGYVYSNFGCLERYVGSLFELLGAYELAREGGGSRADADLAQARQRIDRDFLQEDTLALLSESKIGIGRIRTIVQDLRDFSRVDSSLFWQVADLHQGIDATVNIVKNDIQGRADVIKKYGPLPEVECVPSQINQVMMNLLLNAAQAMGEARGSIIIHTGVEGEHGFIEVSDNGVGIESGIQGQVFDPFFTTKDVGKGSGLGLSVSYGIVQAHGGRIELHSEVGRGSTFRVVLPLRRPSALTTGALAHAA